MIQARGSALSIDDLISPLPSSTSHFGFWQFGSGDHASIAKPILGSSSITFLSDSGNHIYVRHIIVDRSSSWVLGLNLTRKCDLIHLTGNHIRLPLPDGSYDTISMTTKTIAIYRSLPFYHPFPNHLLISQLAGFTATVNLPSQNTSYRPWAEVKRIIDRVNNHTCGHVTYSDMKSLLHRNNLWSPSAMKYLTETIKRCTICIASSVPPPSRRVAISLLKRSFNEVLCLDHFHLDVLRLLHAMDTVSRYSTCHITSTVSMTHSIVCFEASWLSQFWTPAFVHAHKAFNNEEFTSFISTRQISLRPVHPRRHHKNSLETKHGVIRSILLKLKNAQPNADTRRMAYQSVTISNDLYGNYTVSAFKIAKGITKPIYSSTPPLVLTQDHVDAHDELINRRRLHMILRSLQISPHRSKRGS